MGINNRQTLPFSIIQGLVLVLLLILSLGACAPHPTAVELASSRKILLLGNGTEPKGLDPHLATGVTEHNILQALMEGLIAHHPTDESAPEPGVAQRWESNENADIWTFHLNQEARWSNGDPVTAHDFAYSFRRILTPTLGAEYADLLYVLRNAEAFHKNEIVDFGEVGVRVVDAHTLVLELIGPTPYFINMLKHHSWYPVNPRVVEAFGRIDTRESDWTKVGNFVGNGAFSLSEWVTNSHLEVVRNPLYWDAETVKINGIRFYPIEKETTEDVAFRAGQLHYTYKVSPDRIDFYRQHFPEVIRSDDYMGTYFYRFNTTRKPFDNPLVRRALAYAIDKESIVRNVTQGGEKPAFGYVYDGMAGYRTPGARSFDPDEARRLLAEAGYPEGRGFPPCEILINTLESHKMIAEAIQQMWKDHLGINVGIINQEWKVYLDTQQHLKYDISRSGWIGDYVDPHAFLSIFSSDSGNNQTGWKNPTYDNLLRQVSTTGDQLTRFALMQEMERILLDELPIVPIYWYSRIFLIHPDLLYWYPKLLDFHPYKFIDLKPTGFRFP